LVYQWSGTHSQWNIKFSRPRVRKPRRIEDRIVIFSGIHPQASLRCQRRLEGVLESLSPTSGDGGSNRITTRELSAGGKFEDDFSAFGRGGIEERKGGRGRLSFVLLAENGGLGGERRNIVRTTLVSEADPTRSRKPVFFEGGTGAGRSQSGVGDVVHPAAGWGRVLGHGHREQVGEARGTHWCTNNWFEGPLKSEGKSGREAYSLDAES